MADDTQAKGRELLEERRQAVLELTASVIASEDATNPDAIKAQAKISKIDDKIIELTRTS